MKTRMTQAQALKILGLKSGATKEQAKQAYQKLASEFHPDKSDDPLAGDKMVLINAAWALLKKTLKSDPGRGSAGKGKAGGDDKEPGTGKPGRDNAYEIMTDDNTVMCQGEFSVVDLINILYELSGEFLYQMGDAVENIEQLVKLFRAFSSGRKQKVYSIAMLDVDNNVIRIEELIGDKINARIVAAQCLMYEAQSVYVIQSTTDAKIASAHRKIFNDISSGLDGIGIKLQDFVLIDHAKSMSVKQASSIEAMAA